nr:hypothetical protein Iba_chr10aCG7550 [Ipomoea batatas]GMD45124.1 hypothetical protein Iba_chr10dCG7010 [Ipomoea batatas]
MSSRALITQSHMSNGYGDVNYSKMANNRGISTPLVAICSACNEKFGSVDNLRLHQQRCQKFQEARISKAENIAKARAANTPKAAPAAN